MSKTKHKTWFLLSDAGISEQEGKTFKLSNSVSVRRNSAVGEQSEVLRKEMVGATGFEPATTSSQSWRSTKLSYAPTQREYSWIADVRQCLSGKVSGKGRGKTESCGDFPCRTGWLWNSVLRFLSAGFKPRRAHPQHDDARLSS